MRIRGGGEQLTRLVSAADHLPFLSGATLPNPTARGQCTKTSGGGAVLPPNNERFDKFASRKPDRYERASNRETAAPPTPRTDRLTERLNSTSASAASTLGLLTNSIRRLANANFWPATAAPAPERRDEDSHPKADPSHGGHGESAPGDSVESVTKRDDGMTTGSSPGSDCGTGDSAASVGGAAEAAGAARYVPSSPEHLDGDHAFESACVMLEKPTDFAANATNAGAPTPRRAASTSSPSGGATVQRDSAGAPQRVVEKRTVEEVAAREGASTGGEQSDARWGGVWLGSLMEGWSQPTGDHTRARETTGSPDQRAKVLPKQDATRVAHATPQPPQPKATTGIWHALRRLGEEVKRPTHAFPVPKLDIDNRTRGLVMGIKSAESETSKLVRVRELCTHLLKHPDARNLAAKEKIIPSLLQIGETARMREQDSLQSQVRVALALLGYATPVGGPGIRILSIDGGGTRGLVSMEILKQLEERCRRPLYEMFDYVCGVSTGALIAALIMVNRETLDHAEALYKEASRTVFARNSWIGASLCRSLVLSCGEVAVSRLVRDNLGDINMIDSVRNPGTPKMSIVSTVVNRPMLRAFLFRNYNLPPRMQSHVCGSCQHKLWEAVQASSAAPGYFDEVKVGSIIHQDGGILTNNPTALAIHEAKMIWPNEPIQCVLSLGNGRYEPHHEGDQNFSSLKTKVTKIIDSATDTEGVHSTLQDLLPPSVYFRFNPYMSDEIFLDEIRPEKLDQLQQDARMYVRKNDFKLQKAAFQLMQDKPMLKSCRDYVMHRATMMGY
ncbi:PREDICTED: calcium-independent phospholipase A2-gamma-like [Priapulus caudatus]|uniref:Calcium-independent phospholipase A2-gamma-like n=1 Tax=Priapulus caudatus TaxID=37621 RepID=A0ABM1F3F4_PRICU|nr:PREDICTED: calcium-independent phospholipase A2-gamma-like [Priapulus caudatus]XP_014678975.1 PREDICTED: calcium-independent phospholipase A2-gamma-like [Priapulus caudatus]